jgi:hypothetical protein
MVGRGWNIGITLINMLALVNTCQADDKNPYRKMSNIVGGSDLTALGALRVLASLYPGGILAKAFEKLGNTFGIVGVVASTLSGAITAVAGETTSEKIGGGLQALSGVFSLAGFAIGSTTSGFVLLAGGGGLMLLSVVVSNWDNIADEYHKVKRHIGSGVKVVLREQIDRFSRLMIVQLAGASLVSTAQEVLKQLESSGDSGLHDIVRTVANLAVLRTLRFAEEDIDLMTYSEFLALTPRTDFT